MNSQLKEESFGSGIVDFKGKSADAIKSMQAKWYEITGKLLKKGSALITIFNEIPKEEIDKAINNAILKKKVNK